MLKFKITWRFDNEEYSDMVERENIEEAEWQAADNLREMIYSRTSSFAEPLEDQPE